MARGMNSRNRSRRSGARPRVPLVLLALAPLASALPVDGDDDQERADELLARAEFLLEKERYEEAVKTFALIARKYPDSAAAAVAAERQPADGLPGLEAARRDRPLGEPRRRLDPRGTATRSSTRRRSTSSRTTSPRSSQNQETFREYLSYLNFRRYKPRLQGRQRRRLRARGGHRPRRLHLGHGPGGGRGRVRARAQDARRGARARRPGDRLRPRRRPGHGAPRGSRRSAAGASRRPSTSSGTPSPCSATSTRTSRTSAARSASAPTSPTPRTRSSSPGRTGSRPGPRASGPTRERRGACAGRGGRRPAAA